MDTTPEFWSPSKRYLVDMPNPDRVRDDMYDEIVEGYHNYTAEEAKNTHILRQAFYNMHSFVTTYPGPKWPKSSQVDLQAMCASPFPEPICLVGFRRDGSRLQKAVSTVLAGQFGCPKLGCSSQ